MQKKSSINKVRICAGTYTNLLDAKRKLQQLKDSGEKGWKMIYADDYVKVVKDMEK